MALRAVLPDHLFGLRALDGGDKARREHKAQDHGGDDGHDRAKRCVPQYVQRAPREFLAEWIEKLVNHGWLLLRSESSRSTRSSATPLDPFRSTRSEGVKLPRRASRASSAVSKNSADIPAARARAAARRMSPATKRSR